MILPNPRLILTTILLPTDPTAFSWVQSGGGVLGGRSSYFCYSEYVFHSDKLGQYSWAISSGKLFTLSPSSYFGVTQLLRIYLESVTKELGGIMKEWEGVFADVFFTGEGRMGGETATCHSPGRMRWDKVFVIYLTNPRTRVIEIIIRRMHNNLPPC